MPNCSSFPSKLPIILQLNWSPTVLSSLFLFFLFQVVHMSRNEEYLPLKFSHNFIVVQKFLVREHPKNKWVPDFKLEPYSTHLELVFHPFLIRASLICSLFLLANHKKKMFTFLGVGAFQKFFENEHLRLRQLRNL